MALLCRWMVLFLMAGGLAPAAAQEARTLRVQAQPRPGAPLGEFEMKVLRVPVDPPQVPVGGASLADAALVLGIEHEGESLAIPIGLLAHYEVLNCSVGELPIAPTW